MGCVSSNLLNHDEDFPQLGHHIVSLTSTTYGLLSLDPSEPQVINSWELMAGLDADSFRFSPLPPENPNLKPLSLSHRFERICPPKGDNRVVIYTTTLRGVRRTFDACNAVRAAFQGFGILFCERDVSMDSGFREELRNLLKGKHKDAMVPPRVFVKGFYIGGAQEFFKVLEEGFLVQELLNGLPTKTVGAVCEGCGDFRFLPCFRCNGSCKKVILLNNHNYAPKQANTIVLKCTDCNENGLVLCPLCS